MTLRDSYYSVLTALKTRGEPVRNESSRKQISQTRSGRVTYGFGQNLTCATGSRLVYRDIVEPRDQSVV